MLRQAQKVYPLRTSDFTSEKIIKQSSILDLFQDVAAYHANMTGCGLEDFLSKGLAWILVGVRYKILKPFEMYSSVTVKTWPLKPTFAKCRREYQIFDQSGELICVGDAIWTIIDFNERKIVPVNNIYEGIDEYSSQKNFEENFLRVRVNGDDFKLLGTRQVCPSDIDTNNHANNAKYAEFLTDVCGEKIAKYSYLHIDYIKELLLGDTVTLYGKKTDDGLYIVKGVIDGEVSFFAEYGDKECSLLL